MKNKEYTSTQHILKYIGVFGSVEMLKILANLVKGKTTAFLLGPIGAGIIAIYINILDNIRSCTNIGLETAGIQRLSEIDTNKEKEQILHVAKVIRTWSFGTALLSIPVCLLFAFSLGTTLFDLTADQSFDLILLLPAAFFAPIAIGECAILKGTHKLKRVATVELLVTVCTAICTIAIYSILKLKGIVLAINLCIAIEAILHILFCYSIYPYRISPFSTNTWKRGLPLLKFGIPYFITSLLTAITTTITYKFISTTEEIGLYKTGFVFIMYFTGIVLSSNATDYFPRLTSICHDTKQKNKAINKQIMAGLHISTPLTMVFLLAMPLIVIILLTPDFMPITNMCIWAGLFLVHRSVAHPLEYVSLAHGQSWMFLILESIYNLLVIFFIYIFYHSYGLPGTGIALSVVGLTNSTILYFVNKYCYNVSVSLPNILNIMLCTTLVGITTVLCLQPNITLRFALGIPLVIATAAYSLFSIRREISNE